VTKRDVVFLVADGAMEQLLLGFLGRVQCHESLGCSPFAFDPKEDVVVAPTKDPGVCGTARELLRPYENSHERAVVMLDAEWEGSPGAEAIRARIKAMLTGAWEQFAVVVIEPELEAWIWQDNPHVGVAFKCRSDVREVLRHSGYWPDGELKPPDPKAALHHLRRHHRADRSNAAFRRLAAHVSVKGCVDPAFGHLLGALRVWFPRGGR
jgi:hypothetical protein